MAVQEVLSKNLAFPVGKSCAAKTTTLDHVMRILKDHDYIRSTSPNETKDGDTFVLKDKDETDILNDQETQVDFEVVHGVCDHQKTKNENEEQLPKEGIEASDVSSLLEQFLEYEKGLASDQSTSLLTPATSPGHCESWIDQGLVTMDSHPISADLTPPSTPPVLEIPEQKTVQTFCNSSPEKQLKGSDEKLAKDETENATLSQKRKLEDMEQKDDGETNLAGSKKSRLHFEFENLENGLAKSESNGKERKENKFEVNGISDELGKKRHAEVVCKGEVNEHSDTDKSESNSGGTEEIKGCEMNEKHGNHVDRLQSPGEIKGCSSKTNGVDNVQENFSTKGEVQVCDGDDRNNNCERDRESELYGSTDTKSESCDRARRDERQRRRHNSRRSSSEEDSCDDERYDPRKCEQSKEKHRRSEWHSHERRRRHSRQERRMTREYSEYDYRRDRRHHDDKRKHFRRKSEDKKDWNKVRDIEQERKIDFRLGRSKIKDVAKEERRVVYVGGLPYGTTRDELWERFRRFGPIEKVTVHFREGGRDNYGFVTFFEPEDAGKCIDHGNSNPDEPRLDLCFGGRRQYCGGSYVDFDSKTSRIEELSETLGNVRGELPEEEDFDSLLRKYQEETR